MGNDRGVIKEHTGDAGLIGLKGVASCHEHCVPMLHC